MEAAMERALPGRTMDPPTAEPGVGAPSWRIPGAGSRAHGGPAVLPEAVYSEADRAFPMRAAQAVDWAAAAERYADVVYSVAIKFGLSPHDAAEAFQDTWVVALSKDRVPEESGMVPWLAAIACWRCRGILRRRRTAPLDDDAAAAVEDVDAPPPEDLLAAAEEEQAVRVALRSLPERDREILAALYLAQEPLPYVEVAERMGVAVGSVGMLRQRALGRLRGALDRCAPAARRAAPRASVRFRRRGRDEAQTSRATC